MDKLKQRFLFLLILSIGIMWILSIINLERLFVVAIGLGGAITILGAYIALPAEFKSERLVIRFVALQSLSAGICLWVVGVKTSDVIDWIVYFFGWNFVLLPFVAMWVPWLKKNL